MWTGANWRSRLRQLVIEPKRDDAIFHLKTTALLAMRELRQLLIGTYGLNVTLQHVLTSIIINWSFLLKMD